MILYLARDIPVFVMYCVNRASRTSLLIEITDSMICLKMCNSVHSEGYRCINFLPFPSLVPNSLLSLLSLLSLRRNSYFLVAKATKNFSFRRKAFYHHLWRYIHIQTETVTLRQSVCACLCVYVCVCVCACMYVCVCKRKY